MRLALLVVVSLLAGCTQFQEARDDAQDALENAQRDAQEARDRYERVRSATIVRNETVRLSLVAQSANGSAWFEVEAWRGDVPIPQANLTAVASVRVSTPSWSVTCDPLACAFSTSDDANVTWADGAEGAMTFARGESGCAPATNASSFCDLPRLTRERGWALVTTAASDVTT